MSALDRLTAQLIAGPKGTSVLAVVEHCLAIWSQELRAGRLGIRARSTGLVASDVDRALQDRSVVVSWVNRGTLHLLPSADYAWLHALTTPQLVNANARRLAQQGLSAQQADWAVTLVRKALSDGPLSRSQLRGVLDAGGIPTGGQALVHVLFKATVEGVCVRGPLVGKEQAFVLVSDWLGHQQPVDMQAALRELGVRYLRSHGPSTDRDLAKWANITLAAARTALRGLTVAAVEAEMPPPVLLGPWDELLMGWLDRSPILTGNTSVITLNGIVKAIALVEGQAVATWSMPNGSVVLEAFESLPASVVAALDADARAVEAFLRG